MNPSRSAPPTYAQHVDKKYNAVPSAPTMADSDDSKSDSDTQVTVDSFLTSKSDHANKTTLNSNAITAVQLELLKPNDTAAATIDNEAGNHMTSKSSDPESSTKPPTNLSRANTLQRINTLHQDTMHRTQTGFHRIGRCQCPEFGGYEVFLIIAIVFTLLTYATAIYGIYAGNELSALWSDYSADGINADCNGHYKDFTFRAKRGRIKDFEDRAGGMVAWGSVEVACFFLACCVPVIQLCRGKDTDTDLLTQVMCYTWGIGTAGILAWFIMFIQCINYYNKVMDYCDEGTVIYEETMRIFDWLYPLAVFEIVKGSLMICALCLVFAAALTGHLDR